jgi:Fe-S-cluster containining protein
VSPDADPTTICVDECGGTCCASGAFLRLADANRLKTVGHGDAVGADGVQTRTDPNGDCVLLGDDSRCRVYENRPLDCRLFPLGYELDDEAALVRVVVVGCPLAEQYAPATLHRLAERARATLAEFDAVALRAYDDLAFTATHEQLTTIPYDTLPHDL